ncbi:MAG: hypothetical protein Q8Q14_00660 [Gemmatimonadales bacterium]|nr:hypothetical protein [Gemmatimonadales bacterium]
MSAPTVYLTNAATVRAAARGSERSKRCVGPGEVWCIMVRPRHHYGEGGDGLVPALVPRVEDLDAIRLGVIDFGEYRRRYVVGVVADLSPGALMAQLWADPRDLGPVQDGATLICACSQTEAAAGRCHRVFAADLLATAGWRVVLDGTRWDEAVSAERRRRAREGGA